VDVLAGAALNVVFDANRGAGQPPLLFALNPYSNRAGYVTDHLVVRKSGTVRTVSELRGKRIANFPGSVQGLLHQALEQVGLPRTAYQTVEMSPGEWQPALESGSVDAVAALEPYATQMLFDGVGVSIVSGVLARLMPDVPISGHWLAPGYAAQADMGEVSALVRAYAKAIEFCRQRSAEARQYLVPYANVRPDIVSRVNLNPWRLTSPADTAPIGQYVRLLGSESLTSYQILRYLPK
jgi:ABC-type nitrate/sulfonate/bicarbonate transport system substrate-binding protein